MFGRRRHDAQVDLLSARAQAGAAFTALEQLQHQVVDRIAFAAHVDGGSSGLALFERTRALSEQADAAVNTWLSARRIEAQDEQRAAFGQAEAELDAARAGFEGLLLEVGPELAAIETALVAVPPRVQAARQAVHDAEAAVEAQRRVGLAPEAAEEALSRIQRRAQVLDEGPAVHGITETSAAAAEVTRLADEARHLADELPHRRDDMAHRLVSTRSRLEQIETKGARLEFVLETLEAEYVADSWADLAEAPVRFDAALNDAADRLADAEAAARRLAYPEALRLLHEARTALTRADEQARHVTERLAALDKD